MDGEQGRQGPGQQPGEPARPAPVRRLVDGLATPRLDALDGLLRDLDGLRRTLETDLTLAAAAVEAEEAVLAAALVQGDREQLAAFEVRALGHLRALERADAEPPVPAPVAAVAVAPARRRRRVLRLSRLLPAAPLVAAAAALVGLLGIPQTASRPAPPQVPGAVLSSWEELTRLSAQDAPADQVHRAAMELNADIASMLARAGDDPAAARQALALLQEAQAVLSADDDVHALGAALVQARQLAARVLASLPPSARPSAAAPPVLRTLAPVLPTPRRDAQDTRPRRGVRPGPATSRPRRPDAVPQRRDGQGGQRPGTGSAPSARPSPSSSPTTGASPEASPTAAPAATPSPPPSRPSGRPTPPAVLPGSLSDPL